MKARQHNRLVDLNDDETAREFWQSDFPEYRWSIDRALRSFLAVTKRVTWEGEEDGYDHLYDSVVAARPQDDDQVFYESEFGIHGSPGRRLRRL